jgi:hypothetical protein
MGCAVQDIGPKVFFGAAAPGAQINAGVVARRFGR